MVEGLQSEFPMEMWDSAGCILRDGHHLRRKRSEGRCLEDSLRRVLQREDWEMLPSVEKLEADAHVGFREIGPTKQS